MDTVFLILTTVFAALAAVLHVAIFVMESTLWGRPTVWRRFGVRTQADADTIRPMAYNQGFYNLFLALGTLAGLLLLLATPVHNVGVGLLVLSLASMLLAAIVLITSNPRLARAAITQGATPLLALLFLVLRFVV
jgi:putative membrane protein